MMDHAISAMALTIAVGATTTMAATTPDQDRSAMEARLADLERQIAAAEATSIDGASWLTTERAGEIRSLVQDVLADADTRASLLQSGMNAGWNKGFFIASADGNFRLKIAGQLQVRYVYNWQDDEGSSDTNRQSFDVRRAKLMFSGHVVDPTWTFDIQGAFNNNGGAFALEDAGWIRKDLGNGWKVTVGQMKAPFTREEVTSSRTFFAVDRSLLNAEFTAGSVQGIDLMYGTDSWRVRAMWHDGSVNGINSGSANTPALLEDVEYAFGGRFEWAVLGTFDDFSDFSSWRGSDTSVQLGAALNYQRQEFGTGEVFGDFSTFNSNELTNFGATVDIGAKFGGLSLFGVAIYRHLDPQVGSSLDQFGIMAQAGFFFTDDIEAFLRYEWGDFDVSGIEDLSVVTVGVTKYWDKHNLKWTTDIGFGINEVNGVWASEGAGWRADTEGDEGQVVFRSQLQVLF